MNSKQQYVLAIDQGTSSTKTIIFNEHGKVIARGHEPLQTNYLSAGFVEQDPEGIVQNVLASVRHCLEDFKKQERDLNAIKAIGISNQRETFVVWDRTGRPLYPAVVWQCKRSVEICERLKPLPVAEAIRTKTGLLVDPYFSGTKLVWLYENVAEVRQAIDKGEAFFGTIDTWLLYKFTNGTSYYTDYTNASRTLFFNIASLNWDSDLLQAFKLSSLNLPACVPSSYLFGETDLLGVLQKPVPITGMIGDSHAAAFGQACLEPGSAKATLGTGCSVMMNIGDKPKPSATGMVTTICWSTEQQVCYALEGVIVTCGATIEWLKQSWELFHDSAETEAMAMAVEDNQGVYLVPAFSGLGAPYWEMNRKASIHGLTFATTKNHLVRAALETIPYQIKDVIGAMEADAGLLLNQLMVDGGITGNRFVVQFLANQLNRKVVISGFPEVSALGAAYMAGLKTGVYTGLEQLQQLKGVKDTLEPTDVERNKGWYEGWKRTIGYKQ
jgi:glycerol kinase